ncbi:MAG: ROK family protein [Capsulimonadaceae bacterium]
MLIGIDIGGTKSAAVVGTAAGTILHRVSAPTPLDGGRDGIAFLASLAEGACRAAGVKVVGAAATGVSFGGSWDSAAGRSLRPPNLPLWEGMPLETLLREALGVDVAVENDANATALAEHRWGSGRGCDDMAFLTMGTGIGAGLILGGRLYRGRSDLAGEIGHACVLPGGPLCACGKRGCLETLASGTAIGRIGRERLDDPAIDAHGVCTRARAGDPAARAVVDEAARWMGIGIANLLHTLNLRRVILGTLAVAAGDLFLPPIRAAVIENSWPALAKDVEILPAGLGDRAQDAAALAVAASLYDQQIS